jgi:DNA-binding response OmpR family regulator
VSTDYSGGMKSVLAFEPDLVILGADPPQLDCCDLLSEIKASRHTQNIRVVMLVHGSAAERTRGTTHCHCPTIQPSCFRVLKP